MDLVAFALTVFRHSEEEEELEEELEKKMRACVVGAVGKNKESFFKVQII